MPRVEWLSTAVITVFQSGGALEGCGSWAKPWSAVRPLPPARVLFQKHLFRKAPPCIPHWCALNSSSDPVPRFPVPSRFWESLVTPFFGGRSIGMGIYYVSSLSFSWVPQPHVCIELVAFKVSSFSCFVPVFIFKKIYRLFFFFFPLTFWLWKLCPFIVFLYFSSVMAQVFCLVTSWHLLFYDIIVFMISLLSLHVRCVRSRGVSRLGTRTSSPWLGSWGSSC